MFGRQIAPEWARVFFAACFPLLVAASAAPGDVIYVDASASGANDGTSWTDAYNSLKDALADAAFSGGPVTEIWVAAGTYMPDGGYKPVGDVHVPGDSDHFRTFQLFNGLTLYGGFAGGETSVDQRDIEANETILSSDLLDDDTPLDCSFNSHCVSHGHLCINSFCIISDNNAENSIHVVTGSGTDETAVLDGFTITAGNADEANPHDAGGGMYVVEGSPTVRNCTFTGNSSLALGGGIYVKLGAPMISDCTFRRNFAQYGGGFFASNSIGSEPSIIRSVFRENSALRGGGIFSEGWRIHVTDSVFTVNRAVHQGGAVESGSGGTVTNCLFFRNTAAKGGGMYVRSGPTVTNSIFSGNSADYGGGVYNTGAVRLNNCTLHGNTANIEGRSVFVGGGSNEPSATNSIFWGRSGEEISGTRCFYVGLSIVHGGWDGCVSGEVFDFYPRFVNPAGPDSVIGTEDDNLRLRLGSPAIDRGWLNCAAAADDVTDLDGNPRCVDGDLDGEVRVDLGAYEFQPIPCEADDDCDDGQFCTGQESCSVLTGFCEAGVAPCNDSASCTIDSCNEMFDSCTNIPSEVLCDDGIGCTTNTCDPSNPDADAITGCVSILNHGNCDDGNECTNDVCDPNEPNANPISGCANRALAAGATCAVDDDPCAVGECDGAGQCLDIAIATIPCSTIEDCPVQATGCDGELCECSCLVADSPNAGRITSVTGRIVTSTKNRFLTITTGDENSLNRGRDHAIRVTIESLPVPYDGLAPAELWVGIPTGSGSDVERLGSVAGTGLGGTIPGSDARFIRVAQLRCGPPTPQAGFYRDWTDLHSCRGGDNNAANCADDGDCPGGSCVRDAFIHLYHPLIIPGGEYRIEVIDNGCDPGFAASYSTPLVLESARFGDLAGGTNCSPPAENTWCAPDGNTVVGDVVAAIDTFGNKPIGPSKPRAEAAGLGESPVDGIIGVSDLVIWVDAVLGKPMTATPMAPPIAPPCP